MLVDEQLETLRQPWDGAMVLGERAHDLGVVADEAGAGALGLQELPHELVQKPRRGGGRRAHHFVLLTHLKQVLVDLVRAQVGGATRDLQANRLLESVQHGDALERRGEIDLYRRLVGAVGVVAELVGPADGLDHAGHHLLRHGHEVVVVGVRHVELARGELGVVSQIDAFVAELTPDLVHPVQSAHHQHLEVQLWGDAHVQRHVQVVVVRDEGLGRGAACNHVHHGRLHLDEALGVQEGADVPDDAGARQEHVARLGRADQVQVALAVARLLVLEAGVPREHVQARRQHLERFGEERQLAALGGARETRDAHHVPAPHPRVQPLELLQGQVRVPGVAHQLQLLPVRAQVVEQQLRPRRAFGQHTAAQALFHIH
mmetsp:Transcript_5567/g.10498  ORF Transcript_5567/g.10498 Transcript_5567/m.10498 type:complete len:374 (-) Transcript_5567:204-1325(-)